MQRLTLLALLCAPGALAISYQSVPVFQSVDGGSVGFQLVNVTGSGPGNLSLIFIPNAGVNHLDLSCSGTGGSVAYTGAWTLNGPTFFNVPVVNGPWQTSGTSNVTCGGNYGILPSTDLTVFSIATQVRVNGFTADGIAGLSVGDPVSTATGEFTQSMTRVLRLGGPLPLEAQLYYGSLINASGQRTRMGNNWMHNFEWLLTLNGSQALVSFYGAKLIAFTKSAAAWQLAVPERFGYQFAATGPNTYQFLDPRTNLIYTFSAAAGATTLGLSAIQDRNGNTLTVTPPVNGTAQVTDNLGRTLTYTYDAATGNVARIADQSGRSVSFAYSGGNLTQFTDANGKSETFAYTTAGTLAGLMTGRTTAVGNVPVSQTYDAFGRVAAQADSHGNATTITYDQPAGTTSYKNPAGVVMSHTSLSHTYFTGFTDPDNQTATVTYDSNGRRNGVTDRFGDKTSVTYHTPSGYVSSQTDALGNTTSFTWTAQVAGPFTFYNLTRIQLPDGTSASFVYDANGNVTSETDQLGKTSRFTYNSRGQILSATDSAGRATTYTYSASDATLASVTDAAANTTSYSYDTAKRVSQVKQADGSTIGFTYDNLDNVLSVTDPRGKITSLAYNSNGQLQSVTDPLGKSSSLGYDSNNRAQKVTDRAGNSTSSQTNALQLTSSFTEPTGEVFQFAYDTHNRLSSITDPAGKSSTFAYDREDVLTSITDPLSRKVSFTTDKLGRATQMTTPLGEKYVAVRDKFERIISSTDPSGIASAYAYNARGAVAGITVGGLAVTLSRDDSGALTGVTDPNGNVWSFAYDGAGRLASRTDPLKRAIAFSYDKRNRTSGVQTPLGSAAFTYDAAGNLTGGSFSDSTSLSYAYDAANRLTAATGVALAYDPEGRIITSNGLTIARDAAGRISSITYATGKTVTYSYNSVGLLAGVADWVGGTTSFSYDAAGQLTAVKRPNGLATQFTYDADGRIASITEDAGSSIAIQRDAAGKIISETRTQPQAATPAPGVLPLNYDAANQVSGFTYDGLGRVTADAVRSYTWDLASRLTSYSGTSATYDAFGLRTSVTSSGNTQNFVWNYATGLPTLATVQNASADQRYYIYAPGGGLLYAIDAAGNARHFYHFDQNGSTVLLTDDSGSVTDSYGITPYGESVSQTGSTPNPFTWLGAFGVTQEGSSGLYYIRARYYDSATARFLSPDPRFSTDPQQVNPYAYAKANPVEFADVTGNAPDTVDPFGLWSDAGPGSGFPRPTVSYQAGSGAWQAGSRGELSLDGFDRLRWTIPRAIAAGQQSFMVRDAFGARGDNTDAGPYQLSYAEIVSSVSGPGVLPEASSAQLSHAIRAGFDQYTSIPDFAAGLTSAAQIPSSAERILGNQESRGESTGNAFADVLLSRGAFSSGPCGGGISVRTVRSVERITLRQGAFSAWSSGGR